MVTQTTEKTPSNRVSLAVALLLLTTGLMLGHQVHTGGGTIEIRDVRFAGENGQQLSALLYVPEGVTAETPAPGILAVHGYINSRETQGGFAIEFARRGFVVLSLDQAGHGFSAPPAFAGGFGGPAALRYLKGLDIVDRDRIGLEGHSMGGWTVQLAAASDPAGYEAMVLEGSSTGTFGAPDGTPTSPRNLLLVFSLYDEFSALMWGADVPADIVDTAKLQQLFGTDVAVEPGRRYGDAAAGTARELAMPPVTHPGDHLSREAIGAAVGWFEEMLDNPSGLSVSDQTWYWKELGTLLALLGLAVLLFPVLAVLQRQSLFAAVNGGPVSAEVTVNQHRLTLWMLAIVPVATFFPLQLLANLSIPPNPLLPQQITNGVLVWALGNGLLTVVMLWLSVRRTGGTAASIALPMNAAVVGRALLLALAACAVLYVIVLAADRLLLLDFRFWVLALKRMTADQAGMAVIYLPFFTAFFLTLSASLATQLRATSSLARTAARNAALLGGPFAILLLVQYVPLFAGGTMALASQPLLTIVAFQFVPLLAFVAVVATVCHARTGNAWTGAFVNGLLVTWYVVAGTATHAVPFWY